MNQLQNNTYIFQSSLRKNEPELNQENYSSFIDTFSEIFSTEEEDNLTFPAFEYPNMPIAVKTPPEPNSAEETKEHFTGLDESTFSNLKNTDMPIDEETSSVFNLHEGTKENSTERDESTFLIHQDTDTPIDEKTSSVFNSAEETKEKLSTINSSMFQSHACLDSMSFAKILKPILGLAALTTGMMFFAGVLHTTAPLGIIIGILLTAIGGYLSYQEIQNCIKQNPAR